MICTWQLWSVKAGFRKIINHIWFISSCLSITCMLLSGPPSNRQSGLLNRIDSITVVQMHSKSGVKVLIGIMISKSSLFCRRHNHNDASTWFTSFFQIYIYTSILQATVIYDNKVSSDWKLSNLLMHVILQLKEVRWQSLILRHLLLCTSYIAFTHATSPTDHISHTTYQF